MKNSYELHDSNSRANSDVSGRTVPVLSASTPLHFDELQAEACDLLPVVAHCLGAMGTLIPKVIRSGVIIVLTKLNKFDVEPLNVTKL